MTKREAQIFLPHSPGDDLMEVWEQRLFKEKQYFLTRTPTPLVWKSKLKRLFKAYRAYLVLTEQKEDKTNSVKDEFTQSLQFPDQFIEAFNAFHKRRNQHKSEVLQAQTFQQLSNAVMDWLNTESEYASYWSHPPSEELESKVFLSKETDPMVVLKDLQVIEKKFGETSIQELKNSYNKLPENIMKEVKRLTLMSKK